MKPRVLGALRGRLGMRWKFALIADGPPVAFESQHTHTIHEQTQFNAAHTYLLRAFVWVICIC